MLKFILWQTQGIKRQQVEHIGTYNNINFYALRGETDPYNYAYAEIADGYLIITLHINQCQESADQLAPDPLQHVITWFNNAINSETHKASVGVAEYLGRLPEAQEHNNRIQLINDEQERINAEEEQKRREEVRRKLQEHREQELVKSEQTFRQGGNIPAKDFVDLCNKYSVSIPIKTLGWCNKSLAHIKKDGYTCYKGSNKSTVIYNYVDKLSAAMGLIV